MISILLVLKSKKKNSPQRTQKLKTKKVLITSSRQALTPKPTHIMESGKNCSFALFTTRLLRYVLRTVLAYVQNAPGILVRFSRITFFILFRAKQNHKKEYLPLAINSSSSAVLSRPSISFNSGKRPNFSMT